VAAIVPSASPKLPEGNAAGLHACPLDLSADSSDLATRSPILSANAKVPEGNPAGLSAYAIDQNTAPSDRATRSPAPSTNPKAPTSNPAGPNARSKEHALNPAGPNTRSKEHALNPADFATNVTAEATGSLVLPMRATVAMTSPERSSTIAPGETFAPAARAF
jgi:hypothetical protein